MYDQGNQEVSSDSIIKEVTEYIEKQQKKKPIRQYHLDIVNQKRSILENQGEKQFSLSSKSDNRMLKKDKMNNKFNFLLNKNKSLKKSDLNLKTNTLMKRMNSDKAIPQKLAMRSHYSAKKLTPQKSSSLILSFKEKLQ